MLGLLINEMEQKEIEYLIKRELEELLLDLEDNRIDALLKKSMRERYEKLFQLLLRVASTEECLPYLPARGLCKKRLSDSIY
ncbi:hypothetical protein [Oceanobacillus alkalisoli]|uniref:hypothetical protein n=1 Tax=Oceanobacillus alkalisoli TaxID=2925113 RepID=UPI001EF153EE|nr:hypothetical protein [Oceanobacillus alkalisoli]MCF3943968.1 hypothetical protein [Oceanobacillus alkalisoli]MCG5104530.1 hypothetical protein [Oceanobacillus alkalisoli]